MSSQISIVQNIISISTSFSPGLRMLWLVHGTLHSQWVQFYDWACGILFLWVQILAARNNPSCSAIVCSKFPDGPRRIFLDLNNVPISDGLRERPNFRWNSRNQVRLYDIHHFQQFWIIRASCQLPVSWCISALFDMRSQGTTELFHGNDLIYVQITGSASSTLDETYVRGRSLTFVSISVITVICYHVPLICPIEYPDTECGILSHWMC